MSSSLDHIIIAVRDLEHAIADYQALGFTVIYGGKHAAGTTHNALIYFRDGTYIELLAPTGEPAVPGTVDFSPLLTRRERLTGYALRSDDLEADSLKLHGQGIDVGEVIAGGRIRADSTQVAWKIARVGDGFAPF
jgi:catechol 2,3-dioxygenase-like lactoylglutathione lyase family enzyme